MMGILDRLRGRGVVEGKQIVTGVIALQASGRLTGKLMGPGTVYWVNGVDGVGDDDEDGMDPTRPLLTITEALSRCTDFKHDIIVVVDYWQPTGETWPLLVDKAQVTIVGLALPGLPYPAIHPPADTAAFQLSSSGQYGTIALLTIGGGVSHGGIEMGNAGQVDGFDNIENVFGHQWFGTPLNGILDPAAGTRGGYGCRIVGNKFLGDLANCKGVITGNAIDLLPTTASRAWRDLEIRDNDFMGCAIGVNLVTGFDARILSNRFVCADAAHGEAITLQSACRGCYAHDNVAMNGGDAAMTNEPYRDLATGANNHWGVNWTTNAVDLPRQS